MEDSDQEEEDGANANLKQLAAICFTDTKKCRTALSKCKNEVMDAADWLAKNDESSQAEVDEPSQAVSAGQESLEGLDGTEMAAAIANSVR